VAIIALTSIAGISCVVFGLVSPILVTPCVPAAFGSCAVTGTDVALGIIGIGLLIVAGIGVILTSFKQGLRRRSPEL